MAGRVVMPPMSEEGNRAIVPLGFVRGLFDTIEKPMIVAITGIARVRDNSRFKPV
jgi:hypothetical protein